MVCEQVRECHYCSYCKLVQVQVHPFCIFLLPGSSVLLWKSFFDLKGNFFALAFKIVIIELCWFLWGLSGVWRKRLSCAQYIWSYWPAMGEIICFSKSGKSIVCCILSLVCVVTTSSLLLVSEISQSSFGRLIRSNQPLECLVPTGWMHSVLSMVLYALLSFICVVLKAVICVFDSRSYLIFYFMIFYAMLGYLSLVMGKFFGLWLTFTPS